MIQGHKNSQVIQNLSFASLARGAIYCPVSIFPFPFPFFPSQEVTTPQWPTKRLQTRRRHSCRTRGICTPSCLEECVSLVVEALIKQQGGRCTPILAPRVADDPIGRVGSRVVSHCEHTVVDVRGITFACWIDTTYMKEQVTTSHRTLLLCVCRYQCSLTNSAEHSDRRIWVPTWLRSWPV